MIPIVIIELSTESLTASIYEYRYENGRQYQAYRDGQYEILPNDEREQDRLDIVHHLYLLMLRDKLHMAPIGKNPQRILDIGTGTGIWAIDMGESYPSAEVIGTDISPIQPNWVPPNVQFQIDDAEDDWTWEKESFDFIHVRHLSGLIKDWPRLLEQTFEFLKPGGYVEFCEYEMNLFSDDGTFHKDLWLYKFYENVNKAGDIAGRDFNVITHIEPSLKEVGYENVEHQLFKAPIGTWPADPKLKEMGSYALLNCETAFEAYGLALFTRVLGMSQEEAMEVVTGADKDARNRKVHAYSKQHIWWARKPEAVE